MTQTQVRPAATSLPGDSPIVVNIVGTGPVVVPAQPGNDPDWADRAACAQDPQPDRFVDLPPLRIRGKNNPAYTQAVADLTQTCDACPVRDQCFWNAINMDVRGVFAGTDEYDRADLREALDIAAPPMIPAPESDEDARVREQAFAALRYARRGHSNNEIAALLKVSAMTVSRLLSSDAEYAEAVMVSLTRYIDTEATNRADDINKTAVETETTTGHVSQTSPVPVDFQWGNDNSRDLITTEDFSAAYSEDSLNAQVLADFDGDFFRGFGTEDDWWLPANRVATTT